MARGCEVIGDCAYGAGETRVEFAASGQGPGRDGSGLQNQGYFTKTDFQIALQVAGTWTLAEPTTDRTTCRSVPL